MIRTNWTSSTSPCRIGNRAIEQCRGTGRARRGVRRIDPRARVRLIINVVSTAAFQPIRGRAAYGASKAALWAFTRYLAREWAPVRANALCPGTTGASRQRSPGGIDVSGLLPCTARAFRLAIGDSCRRPVARLGLLVVHHRTGSVRRWGAPCSPADGALSRFGLVPTARRLAHLLERGTSPSPRGGRTCLRGTSANSVPWYVPASEGCGRIHASLHGRNELDAQPEGQRP